MDESDVTGALVSTSSFKPKTTNGQSFNSIVSVISIEDKLEIDRSSDFNLVGTSANGYNFEVASSGFVYGFDADTRENYTFKLSVVNNSVSPAVGSEMILKGKLGNIAPIITPITIPATYVGMPNPIVTFTGNNGSAVTSYEKQGLSFAFDNGLDSITIDPSGGGGYGAVTFNVSYPVGNNWQLSYNYNNSFPPNSLFNLNLVLTDGGGLTDTEAITVDFTRGEFNFRQFSTAFNL